MAAREERKKKKEDELCSKKNVSVSVQKSPKKRLTIGSSSQSDQTKEDAKVIENKHTHLDPIIDLDEGKVLKLPANAFIKENLNS